MQKTIESCGAGLARLVTISDAGQMLAVSRPTLNRMITAGLLQTIRCGRGVRITVNSIDNFVNGGGQRHIPRPEEKKITV